MTSKRSLPGLLFSDRMQVVLLAAIFLIPIVAAFLYKPDKFINHGELVSPVRPLAEVALREAGGDAPAADAFRKKWTLVYFDTADCPARCAENLYKMRQVRLAQGKETDRVQYVFVTWGAVDPARMADMRREHPDLRALTGDMAAIKSLAAQFTLPQADPLAGAGRVYVVDPLGNLMMSYAPDADPTGMRTDLARLLRVSQIG